MTTATAAESSVWGPEDGAGRWGRRWPGEGYAENGARPRKAFITNPPFHPAIDSAITLLIYLLIKLLTRFLLFWLGSSTGHRPHTHTHYYPFSAAAGEGAPLPPALSVMSATILNLIEKNLIVAAVDYCGGVEGGPRSGRRSAVAESEMTGDAESHELTEWQGVGWIY